MLICQIGSRIYYGRELDQMVDHIEFWQRRIELRSTNQ
jgi:hypothetical protein